MQPVVYAFSAAAGLNVRRDYICVSPRTILFLPEETTMTHSVNNLKTLAQPRLPRLRPVLPLFRARKRTGTDICAGPAVSVNIIASIQTYPRESMHLSP